MTHSTGAENVLDRFKPTAFGSPEYAREELVAELGSALVAQRYGMTKYIKEDSCAYLKGWLDELKESPQFIKTTLLDVKRATSIITQKVDKIAQELEQNVGVYNGSVGGTYEVMLKFTDQEIRDHIRRYGVDIAGETIKEVAREMAVEQFSALAHQKIPAFEMPNGDVLYVEYNKESDTLDVGQPTNAGLVAQHRFPYDHNIGLDANLQAVNEKLNELEEYRAELQEAEYGGGMRR